MATGLGVRAILFPKAASGGDRNEKKTENICIHLRLDCNVRGNENGQKGCKSGLSNLMFWPFGTAGVGKEVANC